MSANGFFARTKMYLGRLVSSFGFGGVGTGAPPTPNIVVCLDGSVKIGAEVAGAVVTSAVLSGEVRKEAHVSGPVLQSC